MTWQMNPPRPSKTSRPSSEHKSHLADAAYHLPVGPGVAPPVSGVNLVPTETAQLDPVTKAKAY